MIGYLILFIFSAFFFLTQMEATRTLGVTDVNNYLYIAKLIGEGKLLYKDIFLDNFPLATYIAFFYRTITFGNMHLFKLTGTLEGLGVIWLLYWYYWKKSKNMYTALLIAFTFGTSMIFIRTALNQSGVYSAILFFALSFIFWERNSFAKSGIFAALAVLTKAYFFPLGLALFIATLVQRRKNVIRFTGAGLATACIILLPTILFAFPQFIQQTFYYGLVRSVTEPKQYFASLALYDFVICIWLIASLFLRKYSLPILLMTLCTGIFFLLYKDYYYIYLSMLVLVGTFSCGEWLIRFQHHKYYTYFLIGYGILLTIVLSINSYTAISYSANAKILPDVDKLYTAIKKEKPDSLYSYAYLGNGLSYVLGIPPYKNYIDITPNQFENHILDKKKITEDIIKTRTLIILNSAPQNNQLTIDTAIIDLAVLNKAKCKTVYVYPYIVKNNVPINYLTLIRCY